MKRAFTLIELLIVVAIIAILAAIAVPNFLEAQTRSKVARVKADLRTVSVTLESYYTDHNRYPPRGTYNRNADGTITMCAPGTDYVLYLDPIWVTTPIAYLSSQSVLRDPFQTFDPQKPKTDGTYDEGFYRYTASSQTPAVGASTEEILKRRYGGWRLLGAGPDKFVFNGEFVRPAPSAIIVIPYDPTNGTVSIGDMVRSQLEPEVRLESTTR